MNPQSRTNSTVLPLLSVISTCLPLDDREAVCISTFGMISTPCARIRSVVQALKYGGNILPKFPFSGYTWMTFIPEAPGKREYVPHGCRSIGHEISTNFHFRSSPFLENAQASSLPRKLPPMTAIDFTPLFMADCSLWKSSTFLNTVTCSPENREIKKGRETRVFNHRLFACRYSPSLWAFQTHFRKLVNSSDEYPLPIDTSRTEFPCRHPGRQSYFRHPISSPPNHVSPRYLLWVLLLEARYQYKIHRVRRTDWKKKKNSEITLPETSPLFLFWVDQ